MRNRVFGIFSVLFLAVSQSIFAVSNPEITSVIRSFIEKWKIPGASAVIAKDGKTVYQNALGFTDSQRGVLANPESQFRIASVSKPITSIALMKLIEQGKISLQDTVFGKGRILSRPYYLSVIKDSRIYNITVQQLLEHSAGWDRTVPSDGYTHSDPAFFPLFVTECEGEANPVGDSTLIRFALRKGFQFNPGKSYAYSNVGYLVLGKVIESVSGKKYEEFVKENILQPLAIKDISLAMNLQQNRAENEVCYYSSANERCVYGTGNSVPAPYGSFNVEAMNAHGGWISSAQSLVKLLLATDGHDSSPDILSRESVLSMTKPSVTNPNYAKGWSVSNTGNWYHTGSMEGTAAFVGSTPNGMVWAFLFNSRSGSSQEFWNELDRLPWKCLDILYKKPTEKVYGLSYFCSPIFQSNSMTIIKEEKNSQHKLTDKRLAKWNKKRGQLRPL